MACSDQDPVPLSAPVLRYDGMEKIISTEGKDSILVFKLWMEDTDGNVGLTETDTQSPFAYGSAYYYNLWVIQRRMSSSGAQALYIPGSSDTIETSLRLPDLRSDFRQKYISAEIKVSLNAVPYPGMKPDSMVYAFELIDRTLLHSRRVHSPLIRIEH